MRPHNPTCCRTTTLMMTTTTCLSWLALMMMMMMMMMTSLLYVSIRQPILLILLLLLLAAAADTNPVPRRSECVRHVISTKLHLLQLTLLPTSRLWHLLRLLTGIRQWTMKCLPFTRTTPTCSSHCRLAARQSCPLALQP